VKAGLAQADELALFIFAESRECGTDHDRPGPLEIAALDVLSVNAKGRLRDSCGL